MQTTCATITRRRRSVQRIADSCQRIFSRRRRISRSPAPSAAPLAERAIPHRSEFGSRAARRRRSVFHRHSAARLPSDNRANRRRLQLFVARLMQRYGIDAARPRSDRDNCARRAPTSSSGNTLSAHGTARADSVFRASRMSLRRPALFRVGLRSKRPVARNR